MHLLSLALICLAQTETPPTTATTTTDANEQRELAAAERTAVAAERTAAAAEKLAAAAEKMGAHHAEAGKGKADEAPAPAPAPAPGWTGTAGLGLVSLTGNAEALTLTSLIGLERKWEAWILSFTANGAYGQARVAASAETEAEVVALRAMGELRGDRRFTERATGFLLAGVATDHVKSIEQRYYGEAGASMQWLDEKGEGGFQKLSLRTDLALRYINEQRFQYYPVPLNVDDVSLLGPRFGLAFRYALSKNTAFIEEAEVIPNILGPSRVLFNSTTKLSSALTKSLALGISFVVTHDSSPAVGKRPTDTALMAGLDLTL